MSLQPLIPDYMATARRTATCLPAIHGKAHVARDFGWHWEITEAVDFLTSSLVEEGRVLDVWATPQFDAVEWLVRRKPFPFPPYLDDSLHGTFCKILEMELMCRNRLLRADITEAQERLARAGEKLADIADTLGGIRPEVIDFLRSPHLQGQVSIDALSESLHFVAAQLGRAKGVLNAKARFPKRVRAAFQGTGSTVGRENNWVAEFVTMKAADIYRTAFPGPIAANCEFGKPSFTQFLNLFARTYPEAEGADLRRLAREVWRGNYPGQPFAPVGGGKTHQTE